MSMPRPSSKLGARFNEAFLFAAEKHASQTRKKTDVPYISHLMSVASLVLEAGGGEDEGVALALGEGGPRHARGRSRRLGRPAPGRQRRESARPQEPEGLAPGQHRSDRPVVVTHRSSLP